MKFVHTADTHLGFDFVKTPSPDEKGRRRRAEWIYRNFLAVVEHALSIEADLFIHSGDLFNKFYIPRDQLDLLVRPFLDLVRAGIPVLLIPGNHERSEFPFDLFHGMKGIFVFDRPRSLCFELDGYKVGVAGFPFIGTDSRRTFFKALEETEYVDLRSDFNLLVTHQAFDGAIVGPVDFTFRIGRSDTASREKLPVDFEYVAAGHIHRYQVLAHPLKPRLNIVYPGSIQRMSFAEIHEEKGFVVGETIGDRIESRFMPLSAWDMEMVEINAAGRSAEAVRSEIINQSWRFREDLVIRFSLTGGVRKGDYPEIDFDRLRMELPTALECLFAVKTEKRWIIR
ncbi:MAG: metallophosphoesterase [Thermodesulfobacteriota bacterium]